MTAKGGRQGHVHPFVWRGNPNRAFPRPDTESANPKWCRVEFCLGVCQGSVGFLAAHIEGSDLRNRMNRQLHPGLCTQGRTGARASCGHPEPALGCEHAQCSAGTPARAFQG